MENKEQHKSYYILGAGGHARIVAAILIKNQCTIAGFVDDSYTDTNSEIILQSKLVGAYNYLNTIPPYSAHLVLGIGNNEKRHDLIKQFEAAHLFPEIIHPHAYIETPVTIGRGTIIAAGAIIGVEAMIGKGVIINTGAIVEHECHVGDFAHVCPGVKLAGKVKVGAFSQIGIGSSVIERVTIGKHSIIGAGSVVVHDIPDFAVAVGCPAKVIKTIKTSMS